MSRKFFYRYIIPEQGISENWYTDEFDYQFFSDSMQLNICDSFQKEKWLKIQGAFIEVEV